MFLYLVLWWAFGLLTLFISLCIVSVTAIYWWHASLKLSKCCENIPTIKLRPLITYFQLLSHVYRSKNPRLTLFQFGEALMAVFGKERMFMVWIGYRPVIVFYKPETIEKLLNNNSTITKAVEYNFLKPWIGTGLLTSADEKWRKHRKLLTPTFHFQILENFIYVFNEESEVLTKKLELETKKPWTDVVPIITDCTLDAICQTAMGVRLNIQSGHCTEYLENINKMSEFFLYRAIRPWLWLDPVFFYFSLAGWKYKKSLKVVHDFTRKVIKEKKECMMNRNANQETEENPEKKRKAFLELLLDVHLKDESFTEENVREEVDTFMFEGHETTAMSLSWALYELGSNQNIQEKVFEELDNIFQSDYERPIEYEDLKRMRYLECVIKETLRLYPSVFFMGRQLKEKLEVGKYTLMPGCACLVFVYGLHRDPEIYPNPQVFNPDRFLLENSKDRHPYAFIPFSAGPRNCIGQRFALLEQKTILAHILRKFKLTSINPRDKQSPMAGLVLKNADPIKINFALREREAV